MLFDWMGADIEMILAIITVLIGASIWFLGSFFIKYNQSQDWDSNVSWEDVSQNFFIACVTLIVAFLISLDLGIAFEVGIY